jgi:hypothetical protein
VVAGWRGFFRREQGSPLTSPGAGHGSPPASPGMGKAPSPPWRAVADWVAGSADPGASSRIRQAGGWTWRAAARSGERVTSSSEQVWQRCRFGEWSGDTWMGSLGLSTGFSFSFCFLYSINKGGYPTALEKVPFTVTFGPRWLRCPPQLSHFARLG